VCCAAVLAACVALVAGEEIQTGTGHEFACADYSGGKVFLVGKDGAVTWQHPAPTCNELWVLPNGNLLFTTGHGVLEVTREKKVVFEYKTKSEVYACQRLPDGNTFVGECSSGRLLDLDPTGKVVKEVKLLPEGKDGGHAYIRNTRRLPNGNYLATHYGEGVVREYDPQGKPVWEVKAPGGPHSVIRLPNGNTVIALGDKVKNDAKVVEVDKEGKTVWEITNKDLPNAPLKFMTGLHRLPNGNTVFTNWLGHGQLGKAPHIFEVTPDKKVVWTYANHKDMKTISSVQILDTPLDAIKGEVLH
jgi:outer membrane protein assembly factor BamB